MTITLTIEQIAILFLAFVVFTLVVTIFALVKGMESSSSRHTVIHKNQPDTPHKRR
ncbi:MAG: hypothetical protein SF162_06110 [bacterium]|nr:hypothetical protein [bacterium]